LSKSIEQIDVVDAFVEIAHRDSSFPIPLMVLVVTVFAEKLGTTPELLAPIIGARDKEIYGEPTLYTGDE